MAKETAAKIHRWEIATAPLRNGTSKVASAENAMAKNTAWTTGIARTTRPLTLKCS